MKPHARRILFSLAVLIWSAVMIGFYSSGRMSRYLAADFRPIAFAGGLGLGILALFNLFTARQQADCGHDHGGDVDAHDHESGDMHPLATCLLMIVPVALAVAWTKDEYSAFALSRKGLYDAPSASNSPVRSSALSAQTLEEIEKSHPQNAAGYHPFSLMDLFYATGDREIQPLIDGLKVETEGRWMDEKVRNLNGTRKRLYRLFITCCAADSKAIPIVLDFGKVPPDFSENGWVKVSGTMRFLMEDGELQPIMVVDQAVASELPSEESFMRNK